MAIDMAGMPGLILSAESVPAELRALPQWVLWRYEERDGKRTKVPYRSVSRRAESDEAETWTKWDTATRVYTADQSIGGETWNGVGFVFAAGGGLVGVDLDHCIENDGTLAAWAVPIVDLFGDTYAEVSPSGTGIKFWARGALPTDKTGTRRSTLDAAKLPAGAAVEMYQRGRYFTVTGQRWGNASLHIRDCADGLAALWTRINAGHSQVEAAAPATPATPYTPQAGALSDDELLAKIRASKGAAKFQSLWEGSTRDYGSHSEADQALANRLAFWTGGDEARIDHLFRQSGLFREKWAARDDYRGDTIAKAIDGCKGTFYGSRSGSRSTTASDVAEDPAATTITNANVEYDAENRPHAVPLPMSEIVSRVFRVTDNWPRRVGTGLFIHEESGIHWLDSPPSVFGWLQSKTGVIEWHRKVGCVSKEETFHSLRRQAQEYEMVEFLPHEPIWPGHYYAYEFPGDGDGSMATELVDRFSPETDEDRCLILSLFATVFWGGSGGTRPAFVVTSDAGRGAGKSKLTDMVSYLAGGHIELSHNENAEVMRQRLLSPEGMNKRIARLDNVKSLKFSWSDLESMITAPVISGKRMYSGEGTRPNNLTWLITLNGPSMSTDMAQRSVIIKLAPPKRAAQWESDTIAFIDANRAAIIADLLTFLRKEPEPITTKTRWATWEGAVLSRVPDPGPVQDVVAFRSSAVDTEGEEIELVERCFAGHLERLGYDLLTDKVMISTEVAADWYNALVRDKKHPVAVGKILSQFINEGRGGRLQSPATKKHGRGVVWAGKDAFPNQEALYDLEKRIEAKIESDKERKYRKW